MSEEVQALLEQIQQEKANQQAIAPQPAQLPVVQLQPKPVGGFVWGMVAGALLFCAADAVKSAIAAPQPKPLKVEALY